MAPATASNDLHLKRSPPDSDHRPRKRVATAKVEPSTPTRANGHAATPLDAMVSRQPAPSRRKNTFAPGAIVRVALRHFVTYDACQFCPGPHLNMIIGPNGTGKSTIVCAIALGLGGATSLLGRAKDISEFVKHGYERASIEIELQGHPSSRNPIIKRSIQRSNNSSSWKINGNAATFKDVQILVKSFRIQVNNLCQFLPQDKVCEFAQLSPSELLRETQKAAGAVELAGWHEQLIQLRNNEKHLAATTQEARQIIETLEKRNSVQEREVQRYEEREGILRQIKILETRIPLAEYAVAKDQYDEARAARKQAHRVVKQLREQSNPHMDRKRAVEDQIRDTEGVKNEMQRHSREANQRFGKKMTEVEKLDSECDNLRSRLSEIRNREATYKRQMAEVKQEIDHLQRDIAAGPPNESAVGINAEIADITCQTTQLYEKVSEVQSKQQEIARQSHDYQTQIGAMHQQLRDLEDVRNQRLEFLRNFSPDTHRAVRWLRDNRDKFREQVFEPVCLEINVSNPAYCGAIETLLPASSMKAFVCQTEEDYRTFTREVNDGLRLKVNAVMFGNKTLDDYPPPVPMAQLQTMGFTQYALDFVDGPAPVLVALCELDRLHATPISRGDVDNETVDNSQLLRQYIACNTLYTIQRSRYGRRLPFVQANPLKQSRFLRQSSNVERKAELERNIENLRQQLSSNEYQVRELKQAENDLRDQDHSLRRTKDQLVQQKRELQSQRRDYERKKVQLESSKSRLHDLKQAPRQDEALCTDIRTKLHSLAVRRGRCVIQSKECLQKSLDAQLQHTQAFLAHLQAVTQLAQVDRELEAFDRELREASEAFHDAEARLKETKATVTTLLQKAEAVKASVDDAFWVEVQQYGQDYTLDQLQAALISERTKAELTQAANPAVIEQYQARCQEIDRRKANLQDQQTQLTQIQATMGALRTQWCAQVSDMVTTISQHFAAAFERIGCAGEVRLSPHEDFDKWGIDILVKFRQHDDLQALTGQRQSGGERSVSTILYLMALQELAVAPFRVVDEINQGMDPRNERMVHRQLVNVACETLTAQYFLITPKLLPNLDYHPRMKVLCIYNGEWQPDKFPLNKYISNKRRAPT
ncbi:Structural maintenance of chromosomes protein 5 [Dimargaris xerosporica]|nr:Structural maintenance of chromosomes protein 5 [Dimargaris xerosporica]